MSLADKNTHKSIKKRAILLPSLFVFLVSFLMTIKPAYADDLEEDDEEFFTVPAVKKEISISNQDPWEKFNRKIFAFNVVVYDNLLIPFADWYNNKIPLAIRFTFKNIMQNYVVNTSDAILSILDLDLEALATTFWRWAINSVFGVFGADDVAYITGLTAYNKSIGKILHFYHIPRGPYLMLPLLGPSNLRNGLGLATFSLLTSSFCWSYIFQLKKYSHIFSYLNLTSGWRIPFRSNDELIWISFSHSIGYYIHVASTQGTVINFLSASAIDRYISFRTAFFQSLDKDEREYIKNRFEGKTTRKNVCDYDAMVELPDECYEDPKTYALKYL